MAEDREWDSRPGLAYPMLWGFLSTFLLGVLGYFGLLLGAWPLLWLPLFAPVFALIFMRFRLHSEAGFSRFLAGYGICLALFIVLGILFFSYVV